MQVAVQAPSHQLSGAGWLAAMAASAGSATVLGLVSHIHAGSAAGAASDGRET